VILRDANYQIVKETSFRTNEFGTFHGDFDLPANGLNGLYQLEVTKGNDHVGSQSVRVEEYKRPKFEVMIDTLDVDYKLGDTVAVTGHAKTFVGTPLDEVSVRYRITRSQVFPYWSWWRPYPSMPDQEIANGETMTRKDGSFEIDVPLVTGNEVNKSVIYNYKINVDVLDISGETRSAESSIKASSTSVFASLELPKEIDISDLKQVTIKSENVNGKHVAANGVVVIDKLVEDDRYYAKRYWGKTDTTLVDESEWNRLVPSYRYGQKFDIQQLAIEKRITTEGFMFARQ